MLIIAPPADKRQRETYAEPTAALATEATEATETAETEATEAVETEAMLATPATELSKRMICGVSQLRAGGLVAVGKNSRSRDGSDLRGGSGKTSGVLCDATASGEECETASVARV